MSTDREARRRPEARAAAVLLAAALAALAALAAEVASARGEPAPPKRVLFIGNSLTAANDLPRLVEALALASGGTPFLCRAVTFAGFSLEDHWKRGDARRAIREGDWDVVVLQQGPSALPESRTLLVEYARRFAAEAKSVGAQTALYMVWPSRTRSFDFAGTSASYAAAARAAEGLLLPVGDAWSEAWRLDSDLPLYGPDDFHPSPLGSYLAALVTFSRLSGRAALGLPARLDDPAAPGSPLLEVDAADASIAQRAAAAVGERSGR